MPRAPRHSYPKRCQTCASRHASVSRDRIRKGRLTIINGVVSWRPQGRLLSTPIRVRCGEQFIDHGHLWNLKRSHFAYCKRSSICWSSSSDISDSATQGDKSEAAAAAAGRSVAASPIPLGRRRMVQSGGSRPMAHPWASRRSLPTDLRQVLACGRPGSR